jgi:methionyl-tRNA synthetase
MNIGLLEIAIILAIVLVIIWSFIWKGIALWKCGRNNQLAWFVVLLVINTAGILEIIYLLVFQNKKQKSE